MDGFTRVVMLLCTLACMGKVITLEPCLCFPPSYPAKVLETVVTVVLTELTLVKAWPMA